MFLLLDENFNFWEIIIIKIKFSFYLTKIKKNFAKIKPVRVCQGCMDNLLSKTTATK